MRARLLLLVALMLPAGGAGASGLDALHRFIDGTASAQGEFVQKVYDRKHKLTQESSGTLAFQRPGRFRWRTICSIPSHRASTAPKPVTCSA